MATTPPNTSISDQKNRVPVHPYARVVPGGADRSRLRATILFTPAVGVKETADSSLSLHNWTQDLLTMLKAGIGTPRNPEPSPWRLPLAVLPIDYAEKTASGAFAKPSPDTCGEAILVQAHARLLERAFGTSDAAIAEVGGLWASGIMENATQDDWEQLGARVAASLGTSAMKMGMEEGDPNSKIDETLFGEAGQIDKKVLPEDRRVLSSMMSVPQADLAVCIEFQRVEELLCSITCACDDVDARRKAELRRMTGTVRSLKTGNDGRAVQVKAPDSYRDEILTQTRSDTVPVSGLDEAIAATEEKLSDATKEMLRSEKIAEHERLRGVVAANRERAREFYREVKAQQATRECGPVDVVKDLADAFAFAEGAEGAAAFDAAADAHDLASWPTYKGEDTATVPENARVQDQPAPASDRVHEGLQTFFTAQSTPAVARLFGLAVDVEIDLADLRDAIATCVNADGVGFLYLACPAAPDRPLPWSLAKVRLTGSDIWFWPVTEDEVNLGPDHACTADNVSQFDGHVVMGAGTASARDPAKTVRRFEVTSLDVRTATELELQRRKSRLANLQSLDVWGDLAAIEPGAEGEAEALARLEAAVAEAHWEDLENPSTLQTAGLSLLDRGVLRQSARKAARRVVKSVATVEAGGACGPGVRERLICEHAQHIVLDAEDLVIGTRLDVAIPAADGTVWRGLSARIADFGTTGEAAARRIVNRYLPRLTDGFGSGYRIALDSALQAVPARIAPLNNPIGDGEQNVEAILEEALVQWNGSPMGVETSPPVRDRGYVICDAFDFGRKLRVPTSDRHPADLLVPQLRYGWPYRFKMRAVYQGGLSVPVEGALDADDALDGQLFFPAVPETGRPFSRFLRQHRIDAPTVLLDDGEAAKLHLPMGPERGTRLVVRSLTGVPQDGDALRPFRNRQRPRTARRVLIPAPTSFEEAERHGMFDSVTARRPRGLFPRARIDARGSFPVTVSTTRKGPDDERYLTGRSIRFAPDQPDPRNTREYGDPVLADSGRLGAGRYYPDPAADMIAFGLRRPGSPCYLDAGAEGVTASHRTIPGSGRTRRYPDVTPVVIEVRADTARIPRVNPALTDILEKQRRATPVDSGGTMSSRGDHSGWHVIANLASGESYLLDVWSVPSAENLARSFSLVQALGIYAALSGKAGQPAGLPDVLPGLQRLLGQRLYVDLRRYLLDEGILGANALADAPTSSFVGPGGHVAPPKPVLLALARVLHDLMKTRPLPEISAVRTMEITHATNRPARPPRLPAPLDEAFADGPFRAAIAKNGAQPDTIRVLRLPPDALAAVGQDTAEPVTPILYDSTEAILDGTIQLPLDTVDGFEIVARAPLPSNSDFDNRARGRSLGARLAGHWPRFKLTDNIAFYQGARDLFGFGLDEEGKVTLDRAEVTLLRVENIGRAVENGVNGYARVRLRDFYLSDTDPAGTWRVSHRHAFPDGKARHMDLEIRAFSRTRGLMQTIRYLDSAGRARDIEPFPAALSHTPNTNGPLRVTLPATRRPAACDALGPEPQFSREASTPGHRVKRTRLETRRMVTRIRLGREWYSTGEGEELGIVLWPPEIDPALKKPFHGFRVPFKGKQGSDPERLLDLGDFEDADLGPGGEFVTRLGADPTMRQNPDLAREEQANAFDRVSLLGDLPKNLAMAPHAPGPFLAPYAFHRDLARDDGDVRKARYVGKVTMPIVADAEYRDTLAPNETLTVGLMCYTPRFDPEDEEWFVEVDLDIHGMPQSFVRFGLVRYQPNTRPEFRVSRPVKQEAQVLPDRHLKVAASGRMLSFDLVGIAGRGAKSLLDDSLDRQSRFAGDRGGKMAETIAAREAEYAKPLVTMRLFAEHTLGSGLTTRTPLGVREPDQSDAGDILEILRRDPTMIHEDQRGLKPEEHGWLSRWTHDFQLPEGIDPDASLVLFVEERTWRRVASYAIEPLPPDSLHSDDIDRFSPSGASYSARVPLGRAGDYLSRGGSGP